MKMYKLTALLLALLIIIAMLPMAAFAADNTVNLTIIHTNDLHGNTAAYPVVSQMVKDMKAAGKNVLLLDAGDSFHGQTIANLSKGAAIIRIMNASGYNAMAAGNHDFNYGVNRLLKLKDMAKFTILGANVQRDEQNILDKYKIFNVGGIRVGIFGMVTPETVEVSDPRNMRGLTFGETLPASQALAKKLKNEKDCDAVIALAHLGLDSFKKFTPIPEVDLTIDGHSHTALENGLKPKGNMLIAQTGAFAANIGVVELTITNGKVTGKTAKLIPITDKLAKDSSIVALIDAENKKNEAITGAIIGNTQVKLNGERTDVRTKGTNLADVLTDSMRWATGADIAIMTGGNIRASIDKGDITMGEALTVMPWSNLIATVDLKGSEVLKALEHGVSAYPEESAIYIQVSGIAFQFNPKKSAGKRVSNITMADGMPFDVNKTYTIATIEFLANGGDGYDMLAKGKDLKYYGGDTEIFTKYLATNPTIKSKAEDRVTVK